MGGYGWKTIRLPIGALGNFSKAFPVKLPGGLFIPDVLPAAPGSFLSFENFCNLCCFLGCLLSFFDLCECEVCNASRKENVVKIRF